MVKFLPILFVVLLALGVIGWRLLSGSSPAPSLTISSTPSSRQPLSTPSSTLEDRVKELELSVTDLLKKVNSQTGTISQTGTGNIDIQLKNLQASVDDLKSRVGKLESGSSSTTSQASSSTKKPPLYIPLASSLTVSSSSYSEAGGSSFSIDPGDYPGYSSVQLEGNLKVASGNDKAFARVKNPDGTSILSSEVSTSSQTSVWVSSSGFSLGSGNKTYKIEMKTLTGFGATLENARIKVNF